MPHHLIGLALLLLLPGSAAQADGETLGRLFQTPQQRQQLDQQRERNPGFLPGPGDEAGSLTFNGEVRSSNGRRTRWLNGEADWRGSSPAPGIPVGDTLNQATGQRESLLGAGRVRIQNPPPRP